METLGEDELISILDRVPGQKSLIQVSKQFMKGACIRLHSLKNWCPRLLYDILPASPNLLSFSCFVPLSNAHMQLLARSCPKLSELCIGRLCNKPFPFDFDDDGLCAVANACRNLSKVRLVGRLHIGDVGIHSLVTSSKSLAFLDLRGCANITDQSLKVIGEASCLRSLSLEGCFLITDLGLKYLANGHVKYRCLDLSGCFRISDDGIISLKEMVTLEDLKLSRCGVNVTDIGVVSLISHLPKMATLDLSNLINITDISLFSIASACLKLTSLYLSGCEAITHKGLHAFAHHPTLNTLYLNSCHNLSWEDVKSAALTLTPSRSICLVLSDSIKMSTSMLNDYDYEIKETCHIIWL